MRADLDQLLWERIRRCCVERNERGLMIRTVRDVIRDMLEEGLIERPKQAWRTLEKWADQDIYEYGVSLDLGWLVQIGPGEPAATPAVARLLRKTYPPSWRRRRAVQ